MEEALQYVEKVVRTEMTKRKRFPLEWAGGEWSANVCAANCYRGSKEGVGAHADHLTCKSCCMPLEAGEARFLTSTNYRFGPVSHNSLDIFRCVVTVPFSWLCHIDARCVGTTRTFRLREVIPIGERDSRQAQTFDLPLPHNSVSMFSLLVELVGGG